MDWTPIVLSSEQCTNLWLESVLKGNNSRAYLETSVLEDEYRPSFEYFFQDEANVCSQTVNVWQGALSYRHAVCEAGGSRPHLDSTEDQSQVMQRNPCVPSHERGSDIRTQLGNWEMTPKSTDCLGWGVIPQIIM